MMNSQMNQTNESFRLRAEADALRSSISPHFEAADQLGALPAAPLDERALPNSETFFTYKVRSMDEPDRTEVLTSLRKIGGVDQDDLLNIYKGSQFKGAWAVQEVVSFGGTNGDVTAMRITWKFAIPHIQGSNILAVANWIIDVDTNNNFRGTESELAKAPRHITGTLYP
jgi:hypothetical protein